MTDRPDSSDRTGEDAYTAEDGRKKWAEIMGKVRYGGKHVTITYSGRAALAIVPIAWYQKHAAHDDDS